MIIEHLNNTPHRRFNILTGEWVLVSPHRTKRPWQGKKDEIIAERSTRYDETCYLCPTNIRASGAKNPHYKGTYSFVNDFSAILPDIPYKRFQDGLLESETEAGICKVVCFSPDHSLTLPLMSVEDIAGVVKLWKKEYEELGSNKQINYVQIFENKGAIMGCSNPHPHGQIWSHYSIPDQIIKKTEQQKKHWRKYKKSLIQDYLQQELDRDERIFIRNKHFVALVPFWAVWPYETMIVPVNHYQNISQLDEEEEMAFASIIKRLTTRYDNLFQVSFPYSAGIHQSPTDGKDYPEWHFHMSFYPPLLRSAEIKKFMVGYEMFATPQRDITPEYAAKTLNGLSETHYILSD